MCVMEGIEVNEAIDRLFKRGQYTNLMMMREVGLAKLREVGIADE